jgi:large subunit ribosomal protein L23
MKDEARMMNLILAPRVSEKSAMLGNQHRQITFQVLRDANKCEIKYAVEKLFNVKVASVNVLNTKPKAKRVGGRAGTRQAQKKVYVTLQEGYDINFTGM